MNRIKKVFPVIFLLIAMMMLNSERVMAQGNEVAISQDLLFTTIIALIGFIILVLIVIIFSLQSTRRALLDEEARRKAQQKTVVEEEPDWWSMLMAKLTRTVPLEQEQDVMLDHNYDGIRELDNHLPPWWTWLFRLSVVFAVVYLLVYHVFEAAPLQNEKYEMDVAEAAQAAQARQAAMVASGEAFDESTIEFSDDPAVLASGETIYNRQCAACHREDGGGGIGPNLADEYWIHGGSMANIYNTIKVGVLDKGMISWQSLLSPAQMRDVSSYIITLKGTNPENAKEKQGELYQGAL